MAKSSKKKTGGKWSMKYKKSINCRHPKGFSQKQHCKYGRKTYKTKRRIMKGGLNEITKKELHTELNKKIKAQQDKIDLLFTKNKEGEYPIDIENAGYVRGKQIYLDQLSTEKDQKKNTEEIARVNKHTFAEYLFNVINSKETSEEEKKIDNIGLFIKMSKESDGKESDVVLRENFINNEYFKGLDDLEEIYDFIKTLEPNDNQNKDGFTLNQFLNYMTHNYKIPEDT